MSRMPGFRRRLRRISVCWRGFNLIGIGNAEILERFLEEIVKTGIALIETPKHHLLPLPWVNIVSQPVPCQGTLAKPAQRTDDQQGMVLVRIEPAGKHVALRTAAGEVGRHGIRMHQSQPGSSVKVPYRCAGTGASGLSRAVNSCFHAMISRSCRVKST